MVPKYCVNCNSSIEYDKFIMPPFYRKNVEKIRKDIENKIPNPLHSSRQITQSDDNQFEVAPGSPIILGPEYTQGYLRSIIGKKVLIEFLVGTDGATDRSGILTDVGATYIILQETETGNRVLCDIFSIKFVTIFP